MIRQLHTIYPKPPPGAIAVTEPYREGHEDWMLTKAINQIRAAGTQIVLVQERASREHGSFLGIAVYRLAPYIRPTQAPTPPPPPPEEKKLEPIQATLIPPQPAPNERKAKK